MPRVTCHARSEMFRLRPAGSAQHDRGKRRGEGGSPPMIRPFPFAYSCKLFSKPIPSLPRKGAERGPHAPLSSTTGLRRYSGRGMSGWRNGTERFREWYGTIPGMVRNDSQNSTEPFPGKVYYLCPKGILPFPERYNTLPPKVIYLSRHP